MKSLKFFVAVAMFTATLFTIADAQGTLKGISIQPYKIGISETKTTNIIFPHAIVGVDRGSKDILAQKAIGAQNILQVKAAKKGFQETNLSVVTADGKLNSFVVSYCEKPEMLNLSLESGISHGNQVFLSGEQLNEAEVQRAAKQAITAKEKTYGITDRKFGVSLQLTGFYVSGDIFYCRLRIQNRSDINYSIEQFRFFIRDQKKANRTASQEIEVTPIYLTSNTDKVPGRSEDLFVFAIPKFTIPENKYFAIQLMEKNGGRHLELHIKNKHVMRVSPLNTGAEESANNTSPRM